MPRTAIVLSDTHLGTERADAASLDAFLRTLEPVSSRLRLILAGDMVDLWRASDEDAAEASRPVFETLAGLMEGGALVDWVVGNHDHHLLRSLEGDGSPVLDLLPDAVRFHHPHRRLVQRGRVFLVTHGDVYDFLYLPLERFGPLSWVLGPRDVYGFYDWVYGLDKESVAAFDRLGTRGLLLLWIAETWRELWQALAGATLEEAAGRAVMASRMSEAFRLDPRDVSRTVARLGLPEIWERTATALRWPRMPYVSPHPSRVSRRRFAGYHEIVCGHFHEARQGSGEGWAVTDAGAWWSGPGAGGTYVEVADGVSSVRRFPR